MLISEKIKYLAQAIFELCLSEGIIVSKSKSAKYKIIKIS